MTDPLDVAQAILEESMYRAPRVHIDRQRCVRCAQALDSTTHGIPNFDDRGVCLPCQLVEPLAGEEPSDDDWFRGVDQL